MHRLIPMLAGTLLGGVGLISTSLAGDPPVANAPTQAAPLITQTELLARLDQKDPELRMSPFSGKGEPF